MTDGPRQRSSTAGSAKDAAGEESGGVALKKEIGLVSACGIIVGKSVSSNQPVSFHFPTYVRKPFDRVTTSKITRKYILFVHLVYIK